MFIIENFLNVVCENLRHFYFKWSIYLMKNSADGNITQITARDTASRGPKIL